MDDETIRILEDIGLTKTQIKTYLTLLEMGESSTGPLIQKSELHNSVIYHALNHLVEEGLASFVQKGNTKYYQATDPKNLVNYMETKKQRLIEILPKLNKKKTNEQTEAKLYQGWKGIYAAFNSILEELGEGEEYLGFAAGAEEQFSEETKTFFHIYNRKRSEKKYIVKLVANESAKKSIESYNYERGQIKPKYKFVKGISFNGIILFNNKVLQVAFDENPVAIIITSKAMHDSFKKVFYSYWEESNS